MRVIISGGGTGGHIYPALSILNKIKEKEPNSEFLFIGTTDRMEKDIIPNLEINYVGIKIKGIKRSLSLSNLKTLFLTIKAYKKSKKIIKDFNPDIVIGVGGYVTGPVLTAACKLKIPTLIHEQNSVPGLTNKLLSKKVTKIAVSTEDSLQYFPKNKTILTGNPTGEDAIFKKEITKEDLSLDKNKKLVLMVMGSLGSTMINEEIKKVLSNFKDKDYQFLLVTGKANYKNFKDINTPENVHIKPYINNLSGFLKNVDLFISRAGASTVSEIIALNVVSILVPSPFVTNDHQLKNATELKDKEQVILLKNEEFTGEKIIEEIDKILNDKEKYNSIKVNLKKEKPLKSATMIYEEIKKII